VLKPIQDPVEMDFSLDELERRTEARVGYRRAFDEPVSTDGVARSPSVFLRTLRSGDAPVRSLPSGRQ
jgi:hypothetical protein